MQALAPCAPAASSSRSTGSASCGSTRAVGGGAPAACSTTVLSPACTASVAPACTTTRRTRRSGRNYQPFSSSSSSSKRLTQSHAWQSYTHAIERTSAVTPSTGTCIYNRQHVRAGLHRAACIVRCSTQSASGSTGDSSNSSAGMHGSTSVFTPPEPQFSEHDAWKSLEFQLESVGEEMMDAARLEDYHLAATKKAELESLLGQLDVSDYALYELTRPLKAKPSSFSLTSPFSSADEEQRIGAPTAPTIAELQEQELSYRSQSERIAAEIKAAQQLGALGDSRALHTLAEALRRGHDPRQSVDPHRTHEQASAIAMKIRDDAIVEAMWTLFEKPPKEVADLYWSGRHFLQIQNLQRAHSLFNDVIAKAPSFAEGLNKRATVLYLLRQYEASIEDCERVVSILPMHFGALSGAGLCCVALGDYKGALEWLSRARQVYPSMPAVLSQMEALKLKLLEDSGN